MHNRQSGAAHVPMMFFLLLLVMFLGAVGFAFVTNTKNGELILERDNAKADAATLRNKEQLVADYVAEVGNVINKLGKYEGKKGQTYKDATLAYPGVVNPDEVKKVMDDALKAADLSTASGLENVLGSLVTNNSQLKQRVKDIEAERDKALQEKNEVDRKFQTAAADAATKAGEFTKSLDQQRADFESAKTDKEGRITAVTDTLRTTNDALSAEKERAAAEAKVLNHEKARLQMHNSALIAKDGMRRAADVPDGKVLVAKNGVPTAFINLGRKDMLVPGTVFRVKNPSSDKVKGYATVTRIENESAEVSLTNFADPIADYAREGDLLFNELYTPRVTRTIFLMGRFEKPYAKDDITNLLKRLGNRVVAKMAPGVDTVILGNDPINEAQDGFTAVQESPEYKLASELRVEFTYLATIGDLIKL